MRICHTYKATWTWFSPHRLVYRRDSKSVLCFSSLSFVPVENPCHTQANQNFNNFFFLFKLSDQRYDLNYQVLISFVCFFKYRRLESQFLLVGISILVVPIGFLGFLSAISSLLFLINFLPLFADFLRLISFFFRSIWGLGKFDFDGIR